MTELCVLQKPSMILSFESGKMLSKFWPKLNFDQHLEPCKRLTKIRFLITFCNMQNIIIISTNVIIMLAFCPTKRGGYAPCVHRCSTVSTNVIDHILVIAGETTWPTTYWQHVRLFDNYQFIKIVSHNIMVVLELT